jgi:tRNA threonylcarbamoyl adenosine modification protein YeaZ
MVSALLADCGLARGLLSAVAFGQGPGAFTGIRVACGVAQGMGLALQLPLIPIGALTAIASQAAARHPQHLILAALDARMDEVYFAAFVDDAEQGLIVRQPPVLLSAALLPAFISERQALWLGGTSSGKGVCFVGEGWRLTGAQAGLPTDWLADDLQARPTATSVASLAFVGRGMDAGRKEAQVFGGHGESGDQSEMRGARTGFNCVPKMGREMYTKGGSQNPARAGKMQTFEDYLEQSSSSCVLPSPRHERTPHR